MGEHLCMVGVGRKLLSFFTSSAQEGVYWACHQRAFAHWPFQHHPQRGVSTSSQCRKESKLFILTGLGRKSGHFSSTISPDDPSSASQQGSEGWRKTSWPPPKVSSNPNASVYGHNTPCPTTAGWVWAPASLEYLNALTPLWWRPWEGLLETPLPGDTSQRGALWQSTNTSAGCASFHQALSSSFILIKTWLEMNLGNKGQKKREEPPLVPGEAKVGH